MGYHQKSGFSNFNVAIGFCRRKLLFDAVEELSQISADLIILKETIEKKESINKPISIQETKRVNQLSRRSFELKRYINNMENIIKQYLDMIKPRKLQIKYLQNMIYSKR